MIPNLHLDPQAALTLNAMMRGEMVQVGDIVHANNSLRRSQGAVSGAIAADRVEKARQQQVISDLIAKADNVGPLSNYGAYSSTAGAELAPLVPQSISPDLASITTTASQARLWQSLTKIQVGSPMHNQSVVTSVGNPLFNGFMAEGAAGSVNPKSYTQTAFRSRYAYNKFNVSFVSTITNMVGPYGAAVPMVGKNALETERNTSADMLAQVINRNLYYGDSTVNPYGFDGLLKQIGGVTCATTGATAGAYVIPSGSTYSPVSFLAGATPTYEDLIQQAALAASTNRAGAVSKYWMTPAMYGQFYQQAATFTRANDIKPGGSAPFVFAPTGKLYVPSPYTMTADGMGNMIPGIELCFDELMNYPDSYDITSSAVGDAPPVISGLTVTISAGAPASGVTSYFGAADAGSYEYYLVGVGSGGVSAPKAVGAPTAQAVASGQVVTIEIQDAGIQGNGDAQVQMYFLIRSAKDSTSEFNLLHYWPVNAVGAASGTRVVDNNLFANKHQEIIGVTERPQLFHWLQFLDLFQFPLAMVATSIPVLLLQFGTPAVLAPKQNVVIMGAKAG